MTRRVVITGMGTVNALSCDLQAFWRALCAGKSGVTPIEQFDTKDFRVHFGGEVKHFHPEDVIEPRPLAAWTALLSSRSSRPSRRSRTAASTSPTRIHSGAASFSAAASAD